jgi:uncharacterized protein YjbI with pentapeptide repeats
MGTVVVLLFTWQSIRQVDDEHALTREGLVTDRYNAAVTNIADESMEVRLGGIYVLQRIMEDSPRDQPSIVAVLSTYVRNHAKRPKPAPTVPSREQASDIQAALTALGSRKPLHDGTARVDLSGAYLPHTVLHGANLNNTDFSNVNLYRADLSGANLPSTSLFGADLTEANLFSAHLSGANAFGADLRRVDLRNADLSRATLLSANLSLADLRGADLSRAGLTNANLSRAHLSLADMRGVDLRGADLSRANLRGADLRGADLRGADLRGADLRGADLHGADLHGADLRYAKRF